MSFFTDMLERLTDRYRKDPDSNIGKIIKILTDELDLIKETFDRMEEWEDVEKAEGVVLDDIGKDIGQPRGAATDEIYRILLRSKVARNLSDGTIDTIIRVLSIALNADPKEIRIQELCEDPVHPEPAAISLIQIPLRRLNEVGMSPKQFAQIVKKTVAAGIRVASIELTGTFSFSSQSATSEYSDTEGFSDINQVIGGYLGAAFADSDDSNLPV
ncbi:hypothetical protein BV455_02965 [Parageobacillus caldoxylosilyticus]|uniref:DUF2612 domain-containing protein n=1 Tax=Saccharococcus caldoxylosilyticus TaxID=81408 RepID=UPI001C4DFA12|nr:DUF2612 domain-containing protein [Parageobacillus caldoxylosilyticus]QXJ39599.1 hypothetical protein BV455_02965 [Parageobacillus caldoxylosilyticus]